jgi:hypothetical protein
MPFRLTATAFVLAALGPLAGVTLEPDDAHGPVPMVADDGKTYLVGPEESLGSAMSRNAGRKARASQSDAEQGACVPEPMEDKPAGSVACRCYEVTQCKGNESHQCKRHCRKDLCQCCDL